MKLPMRRKGVSEIFRTTPRGRAGRRATRKLNDMAVMHAKDRERAADWLK